MIHSPKISQDPIKIMFSWWLTSNQEATYKILKAMVCYDWIYQISLIEIDRIVIQCFSSRIQFKIIFCTSNSSFIHIPITVFVTLSLCYPPWLVIRFFIVIIKGEHGQLNGMFNRVHRIHLVWQWVKHDFTVWLK